MNVDLGRLYDDAQSGFGVWVGVLADRFEDVIRERMEPSRAS